MLDIDMSMRVATVRSVLATQGMMHALAMLNGRTLYRYTGIYKLIGAGMHAACVFDKHAEHRAWPDVLPLRKSVCRQMIRQGEFTTRSASLDARLAADDYVGMVESYCGRLLAHASGLPYGSLMHFDVEPRPVNAADAAFLCAVASVFRDCFE